jgi:hypothetical protein
LQIAKKRIEIHAFKVLQSENENRGVPILWQVAVYILYTVRRRIRVAFIEKSKKDPKFHAIKKGSLIPF